MESTINLTTLVNLIGGCHLLVFGIHILANIFLGSHFWKHVAEHIADLCQFLGIHRSLILVSIWDWWNPNTGIIRNKSGVKSKFGVTELRVFRLLGISPNYNSIWDFIDPKYWSVLGFYQTKILKLSIWEKLRSKIRHFKMCWWT